ncbi:MAG: trimeric autotransporter adhesin, partial [Actinomycetota bacterium]|nr:trimeric autotransporter adhesin [Actinomycetota bacterium]
MGRSAGSWTRRSAAFLAALLIISLGTALPSRASASAPPDPAKTPPSQKPTVSPSVKAKASKTGVKVSWSHFGSNAKTFSVSRSGGGNDVNLTPKGVSAHSFVDTTVKAATGYTYTVKVDSVVDNSPARKTAGSAARTKASAGQKLGSSSVTTPKDLRVQSTDVKASGRKSAKAVKPTADHNRHEASKKAITSKVLIPSGKVTTASHSGACLIAGGALTAASTTWSAATCPNGYEVQGDVVVPAGKTLTITPGTTVYFDTSSGADDAAGTTGRVDLLVLGGTLTANGNSANKVVFTSINTSSTDSGGSAAPGDWGVVFGDTGSTMNLSWDRIQYGTGVAFNEIAPALSNVELDHEDGNQGGMAYRGGDAYNEVLQYWNPPAGSTVSVNALSLSADASTYGFEIRSIDPDVNGFTANVTNSTLTGYYPLWVEDDAGSKDAAVIANISGNTIREIYYGNTVGVTAYEDPVAVASPRAAAPLEHTASVSGTIANNTMDATVSGWGTYVEAASEDGSATHTVGFVSNTVRSYYDASENYAYASNTSGAGTATLDYPVTGGKYWSNDSDAWYDYAEAYSDGDAYAGPEFSGVDLSAASDYPLYVESYSAAGNATSVPTATDSTFYGYYDNYVYAESAYDYAPSGVKPSTVRAAADPVSLKATANPTFTNTKLKNNYDGEDYAVYNEAYGYAGSAEAIATLVNNSAIEAAGGIYSYAEGYGVLDTDSAVASPHVTDSKIHASYYEGLYPEAYQYVTGDAVASPTLLRSYISADDDYGIYNYAYADPDVVVTATATPVVPNGHAVASAHIDNSRIESYDGALESYAYAYNGAFTVISPLIENGSTLDSRYYEALYLYGYVSGAGNADVTPTATDSVIKNDYDDDTVYLYVDTGGISTGDTHVGGSFDNVQVSGDDDGFNLNAYGGGVPDSSALIDTAITNTNIRQSYNDGLDVYSENNGGTAIARPTMTGGSIQALQDYATEVYSQGWGTADNEVTVAAVLTN